MKIGLLGINSAEEENHFIEIYNALGKDIYGIFSPKPDNLLPISQNTKVELFSSANDLFLNSDIIYIANSIKPNYDFAIDAIKKSCHLFIEDIFQLNIDEIKHLYKVASEANSKIHIKQAKVFYSEHLELSDYFENPKLIELNTSYTNLLRKQNYLNEIFTNLYLANTILKSSVKKTTTIANPINPSNFSLIHIRVDYDNGATANIKLNNLSSIEENKLLLYQKDEIIDIDFIDHFGIIHKFENGKVQRKEYCIDHKDAFKNEFNYFRNICCNDKYEDLSESPSILSSIKFTFEIMNQLEQVLLKA